MLKVQVESKRLMKLIYDYVKKLPKFELYVSIPQILRSALSVGSNLAEGKNRDKKEFSRFVKISRGSLDELKFQIQVTAEEYRIDSEEIIKQIELIGKMTYNLLLALAA